MIINLKCEKNEKKHIQIPNGKDFCLPCCGQYPVGYLPRTLR